MNKFTEASLTYFFNERNNARKEYDTKIAKLSNDFFAYNNLPFKVGNKVKQEYKLNNLFSNYKTNDFKHW